MGRGFQGSEHVKGKTAYTNETKLKIVPKT